MDISAILSEEMVFPRIEVETKRQFFKKAAEIVASFAKLDENKVFEALWERENLGTTGYGDGVAVPHARISGVDKVIAVFMRLNKAIDFEAHDGKDVDLLAVIVTPEQSGEDHLKALSMFSSVLRNENARTKLRQAKNAHEIYSILNQ